VRERGLHRRHLLRTNLRPPTVTVQPLARLPGATSTPRPTSPPGPTACDCKGRCLATTGEQCPGRHCLPHPCPTARHLGVLLPRTTDSIPPDSPHCDLPGQRGHLKPATPEASTRGNASSRRPRSVPAAPKLPYCLTPRDVRRPPTGPPALTLLDSTGLPHDRLRLLRYCRATRGALQAPRRSARRARAPRSAVRVLRRRGVLRERLRPSSATHCRRAR
jgi:hypothetical protein